MRILAEGLTHVYNPKSAFRVAALRGVDLEIREGEFFGIIGHTGSGKSTFLQHLNALIPVGGGKLTVGEFDLTDKKCDRRALRARVGMVFQYPEYQLFAETVAADVAFGLKNFKGRDFSEEETEQAVRRAIETVGLDYAAVKDKSPFDLSGGQKRRVAIAGVIVTRPEVLVLDEPAAGLDPKGKEEIMKLLHVLRENCSPTVIIVSHDMDEIAENCDRVAVFSEGKAAMCGTPAEIFSRADELRAMGLDVPVTAAVAAALRRKGLEISTDFTRADFADKVAALRPERTGRAESGNAEADR